MLHSPNHLQRRTTQPYSNFPLRLSLNSHNNSPFKTKDPNTQKDFKYSTTVQDIVNQKDDEILVLIKKL